MPSKIFQAYNFHRRFLRLSCDVPTLDWAPDDIVPRTVKSK